MSGINFYITSGIIVLLGIIAFFFSFEKRKPKPREIVILAVMCAIAAVSRVIFQVIPFVSPIIGFVIITGVSFGPQAGFLCGALGAFISNFSCGQGPWTPWQMLAYGMAGVVAGLIYKSGKMKRGRINLTVISYFISHLVVGTILDVSGMFIMPGVNIFDWERYIALLSAGFVVNIILGVSTAVTVLFLAEPMFRQLDRVKIKYGLMD